MEPTPFNLQHAIDQYIANVNNQGSLTNADAMELTVHLYDATADLQQNNLTEEEAFLIATKRMGTEKVLTEEYAKVNPSVHTNKVWAYLFIGFNLFYTMPSLIVIGVIGVYYGIYFYFQNSPTATILVTLFNVLFTACIWLIVIKKNEISEFLDKQVSANSLRITIASFLPLLMFFVINPQIRRLRIDKYLYYPMREWNASIAEFTYYMAVISIIGVVLCLIFTINNKEKFSLKGLFEKPSYLFLICFGVFIELLAASCRSLNSVFPNFATIPFGLVYLVGAFLVSYYNQPKSARYILLFVMVGFMLEVSGIISVALSGSNFYHLIYYSAALLLGVLSGSLLGRKYGRTNLSPQSA